MPTDDSLPPGTLSSAASPLGFTVHVLMGVTKDGMTEEVTKEFSTWAEAIEAVAMVPDRLMSQGQGFHAITIIHTEDFPRLMQGATHAADETDQWKDWRGNE